MPLCSYVVIPESSHGPLLAARMAALPGCEVVPAVNCELMLLLTETTSADEERALRQRLESLDGLRALVLAFGDIDLEDAARAHGPPQP